MRYALSNLNKPPSFRKVGILVITLAMIASLVFIPGGFLPGGDVQAQTRTSFCDRYMEDYARSSARKIRRALSGQSYSLSSLSLESPFEYAPQKQRFSVFLEENNMAAAMIDPARNWRTTYVMVMSNIGPVIASHTWPERSQVASGKAACEPTGSSIEIPQLPTSDIDIEPFRYWGLRVVWRLPRERPESARFNDIPSAMNEVLRRAHAGEVAPSVNNSATSSSESNP